MSDTVKLKLLGAKRYSCHLIGEDVIEHGQTFYVSPEVAETLLKEKMYDALNNEHDIFKDVTGTPEASDSDDEEEIKAKPARVSRSGKK